MAPLVKEFQKHRDTFETVVCVTGQHRQMLDQVLDLFEITPDYDLDIMKQGQDLYDVTARVLTGMRDVLADARPDVVLVHGDTATSTAAGLAAFYQQIPVGHVEAGLRTHNIYSPWPEEMNRLMTGRISTVHFSPTPLAKQNLLQEHVDEAKIVVTGNTVIDALQMVVERLKNDEQLAGEVKEKVLNAAEELKKAGAVVEYFSLKFAEYVVPTYYIIASGEASSNLERFDGVKYGFRCEEYSSLDEMYRLSRTKGFGEEVKRRILLGTFVLSEGYYDEYYLKALKVRRLIKEEFDEAFEKYDMILSPVAPTIAPKMGSSLDDTLKMYMSDVYTVAANLCGLPAISVPCGESDNMPIGVQFIGKAFDDYKLMNMAVAYEKIREEGE